MCVQYTELTNLRDEFIDQAELINKPINNISYHKSRYASQFAIREFLLLLLQLVESAAFGWIPDHIQ